MVMSCWKSDDAGCGAVHLYRVRLARVSIFLSTLIISTRVG